MSISFGNVKGNIGNIASAGGNVDQSTAITTISPEQKEAIKPEAEAIQQEIEKETPDKETIFYHLNGIWDKASPVMIGMLKNWLKIPDAEKKLDK